MNKVHFRIDAEPPRTPGNTVETRMRVASSGVTLTTAILIDTGRDVPSMHVRVSNCHPRGNPAWFVRNFNIHIIYIYKS
jgi:hypothetical protein